MGERLRNGEFYAEGAKIFRAPVWSANDGGGNTVSIGFHACTVTEWCDPASVVSCLNASRHHEDLVKALEELQSAETTYRMTYDLDGYYHQNTLRARDALRSAGFRARALLADMGRTTTASREALAKVSQQ